MALLTSIVVVTALKAIIRYGQLNRVVVEWYLHFNVLPGWNLSAVLFILSDLISN